MKDYNFNQIEKKWQARWEETKPFRAPDYSDNPKKIYVLEMFTYPSATGLHVGHPEGFTAGDIIARKKRLEGYDVMHPMGFDAFGLPAEQFALKTGNHPATFTYNNIDVFRRQIKSLGFSYDWERESITCDPAYYRWTQRIFVLLYKKGLAEYRDTEVNWCEGLGTVLSNEEVLYDKDGNPISERGSFPVTKKIMKQWVFKITEYADRLIDQLPLLDWTDSIKNLQTNWIGREFDENGKKTFKLRDWIFARQRYWGEPFPIYFDEEGNEYLIENELVELPHTDVIKPTGTGEGPLANLTDWVNFEIDGKKYRRETSVMPNWAGSNWYYLAYLMRNPDGTFIDIESEEAKKRFKHWLPVDIYIGGQEHAVLHLIYSRFWHMVLFDLGIVETPEPFIKLVNQGMILGNDGTKMSKSIGNVINPDEVVQELGADTLRLYEMFMGPLNDDKSWNTDAIQGVHKWLKRVYRLVQEFIDGTKKIDSKHEDKEVESAYNKLIRDLTNDIDEIKFNVGISKMMTYVTLLSKQDVIKSKKYITDFLIILSTFAPHIAEELLQQLGEKEVVDQVWPTYDEKLILNDGIHYSILVNNKLRDVLVLDQDLDQKDVEEMAVKLEKIKPFLEGKTINKLIFVKGKTINILTN